MFLARTKTIRRFALHKLCVPPCFVPTIFSSELPLIAVVLDMVVSYLLGFLFLLMHRTVSAMASTSKKGALIFLHGLGDSPAGWSHLEQILPELRPKLSNLEYVFPAAPTIPISINGGMRMPGWFDLYDWPIEVGSKDDPDGLAAGVKTVEDHVKELNAKGITSDKIIVGGFSQGGAIALLTAYQSQTKYAGCVGLSAWLTLPDQLKVSEEAKKTPLYWGHGTLDDKVVFAQQAFGVKKLRGQGVDVKDESFSMGHSSHPQEMSAFAEFVEKQIFTEDGASSDL